MEQNRTQAVLVDQHELERQGVLSSYKVIVKLIASTKTKTGLKVYALKEKVTDEEMQSLNLHPDKFHGEWNYAILPRN